MNRNHSRWLFPFVLAGVSTAQRAVHDPARAAAQPPAIPVDDARRAQVRFPGDALPEAVDYNRFGGDPQAAPALLDDGVPRAARLETRAGEHGDTLVAREEADPFYLGFAGGSYYPSEDERLDPELLAQALELEAAGASEVHGFVMFSARMTADRVAALQAHGVRVLGQHPYYCLKAALPIAALDQLAALDFVRWIGVARAQQKVHPNLALAPIEDDGRIDVYIDVFESDLCPQSTSEPIGSLSLNDLGRIRASDDASHLPRKVQSHGAAHAALTALDVEVLEYIDNLRAFRARILPQQLETLVARNFVQFVEPDLEPTLAHDESTPMIGNDIVRNWTTGNTSSAIAVGQADSGYDVNHGALSIYSYIWDYTGAGPYTDGCEHGTHVLGTILGNGVGSYSGSGEGVASGLGRVSGQTRTYISRIFNDSCGFSGTALSTILGVNRNGYWDGVYTSLKPIALNNSWGSAGIGWVGTEADPRTIDDEVYNYDQLYVWAAGNQGGWGAQSILLQATAKNALTVGAVVDNYDPNSGFPSSIADFSSRGPCGDQRWKPNVVAPGSWITSCDSGTASGYRLDEGTSMAAPHVTGFAAAVADLVPWVRYEPAAIGSILMSSAETKLGITLDTPSDQHLRDYGTGRVEQCKAILGSSDYYWNTWAFDAPWPNWQYADFNVPAGCARITVCMNYYEPAASAGASQALVNDWNLYIDDPWNGIDPAGNTGDWFAQQSTRDNCEIRTLNAPTAGTWRWKAWPQNIAFASNVKMGVTVTFEFDTPHCNPTFDVSTGATYLQPNQLAWVSASASNYDGLATGVSLDMYTGASLWAASGGLFDGSQTDWLGNVGAGRQVELGDLPPFYGRSCNWLVSWPTEGVQYLGSYCDIDNVPYLYDSVSVIVDGTPPPLPTGWGSYTHTVNTWSNNPTMYLSWNIPTDNLSGIQGYAVAGGSGFVPDPGYSMTIGNVATTTASPPSSNYAFYVTMRPVDNANNWNGGYVSAGPYYVDAIEPTGPFSLGSTSHALGSTSCDTTIDIVWNVALDYESYIAGYTTVWDNNPSTPVSGALNQPWYASSATSPALGNGVWYCHIRTQDYAGNVGPTLHLGPFTIDTDGVIGTYCTAKTNSLGCVSNLSFSGTPSATAPNGFVISASNVLNQKSGQLIYSLNGTNNAPFQGGILCVRAPVRRTVIVNSGGNPSGSDCSGTFAFDFNAFARGSFATAPAPELSIPGTHVTAQWWGRDPGFAPPNGTSLSRGLEFVMCN